MTRALQLPLFSAAATAREQRWTRGRAAWVRPGRDHFVPERYAVTAITEAASRQFVLAHHYAASYPAARLRYGLVDVDTGELAGAAVLSVPVAPAVLTGAFPTLTPYQQSLELGRFVLLDSVGFNGETWFLARAYALAAAVGLRGVVSFSDPVARTTAAGRLVFPGHIGGIYQAASATYCGRGTPRRLVILPDGRAISARALQKVRGGETGAAYVERLLVQHGARPRPAGQSGAAWLRRALDDAGARLLRHPGNHRYCFRLGGRTERRRVVLGHAARTPPGGRPSPV